LYPVAHEGKRSKYGGSYFEDSKFWEKEIHKNHFAAYWAMFEEIIFLKGVYEHNKKLWIFSFPFHLGLYLITGTFFLIVLSVILDISGAISLSETGSGVGSLIDTLTIISGYAGLVLTFIGCLGLIAQRLSDKKFKFYNTPMDFINLFFILIITISISITFLNSNGSFIASKGFVKNLFTFNFASITDVSFIIHIVLISLFLLYFPITRMMHLFAKYFTYHQVRWEDEPNRKGGKLESKVKEALKFGVNWAAPHIKTGKTWAEVATTFPPEETK